MTVFLASGVVWAWSEDDLDPVALPKPPHLWGTRAPFTRAGLGLPPLPNTIPFAHLAGRDQIEAAGIPIVYGAFHLRPYGLYPLPPALLAIDGRLAGSGVDAVWTLTSTSVTGIAKGTMRVAVASDPIPAASLLERPERLGDAVSLA